jgi:hypothetical protein
MGSETKFRIVIVTLGMLPVVLTVYGRFHGVRPPVQTGGSITSYSMGTP